LKAFLEAVLREWHYRSGGESHLLQLRYRADNEFSCHPGRLFADSDRSLKVRLRDYLVASYLAKARRQLPAAEIAATLVCFKAGEGARMALAALMEGKLIVTGRG